MILVLDCSSLGCGWLSQLLRTVFPWSSIRGLYSHISSNPFVREGVSCLRVGFDSVSCLYNGQCFLLSGIPKGWTTPESLSGASCILVAVFLENTIARIYRCRFMVIAAGSAMST